MGWGGPTWGSLWGGGMSPTLSIVKAIAIGDRIALVELSRPPRAKSTIGAGDALNPRSWRISRSDTGQQLIVEAVAAVTLGYIFQLYTLKKFGSTLINHLVLSTSLVDPNGVLIQPPNNQAFIGCIDSIAEGTPGGLVDIASIQSDPTSFSATMRVNPGGDYATQTGIELLKKLVIRRLTTSPNEFFFLDNYGLGLRVKEPLRLNDMAKMRIEAINQLQQEPEFSSVDVALSLSTKNVLTINVRATLAANNQQVDIPIPVPVNLMQI